VAIDGRYYRLRRGIGEQKYDYQGPQMSDVLWCYVTSEVNDIPARKRRRLNRPSSRPSIKIRPNQFIPQTLNFSLKHFNKSFSNYFGNVTIRMLRGMTLRGAPGIFPMT